MISSCTDLAIDDDFEIVWMEYARDVGIELVKFVNHFAASDVPQNAVVEDKIVGGVESGLVPRVIIRNISINEFQCAGTWGYR